MQLLIQADQFVISYSPVWMFILLLSGLLFFFMSKIWRASLKKQNHYSFIPGILFVVSVIFLIGGINLYVFKIVFNKDRIILFNIQHFNQQIRWLDIERVVYQKPQQVQLFIRQQAEKQKPVIINLAELDAESMTKVRILIDWKVKQSHKSKSNG